MTSRLTGLFSGKCEGGYLCNIWLHRHRTTCRFVAQDGLTHVYFRSTSSDFSSSDPSWEIVFETCGCVCFVWANEQCNHGISCANM